jgi:hypothetical protein
MESAMGKLLNINQYARLLLDSLEKRQALIEILRGENSPHLGLAEEIQHQETALVAEIANQWKWNQAKRKPAAGASIKRLVLGKEIPCVEVPTFAKVPNGELAYIPSADHFALKIAGVLIHGNIGQFIDGKNPEKIKNCKNKDCKRTYCGFYHDPVEYGGSDRRNFIKNYYGDHPAGFLNEESLGRFSDRVMHDILTLLANAR